MDETGSSRVAFQPPAKLLQLEAGRTIVGGLPPSLRQALPGVVESKRLIVVVDTDLLLSDLRHTLINGHLAGLGVMMRTGLVRPFAAMSVWYEVLEKVTERAAELDWDPDLARETWLRDYAPWIDFIDTSGLPRYRRISEGARRDADDIPTAQLVLFLTADILFSRNRRHYPGLGALDERYAEVIRACRNQSVGDAIYLESTFASSMTASLAIAGVQGVVNGLVHMDRKWLVGLGFLAALLLIWPTSRQFLAERAPAVGKALGRGLEAGFTMWTEQAMAGAALSQEVQPILAAYRRIGERPPYVRDRAATVLARSDVPLTTAQLWGQMKAWDTETTRSKDRSYLRRVLSLYPEQFRETAEGRWYLDVRKFRPVEGTS